MYVIEKYRAYLKTKSDFSDFKIERICYAAESIFNDVTKIVMLFLIGYFIGGDIFL